MNLIRWPQVHYMFIVSFKFSALCLRLVCLYLSILQSDANFLARQETEDIISFHLRPVILSNDAGIFIPPRQG